MGLYGSPYDYVIHVAIIATSRVALITSFQPPLLATCSYALLACELDVWQPKENRTVSHWKKSCDLVPATRPWISHTPHYSPPTHSSVKTLVETNLWLTFNLIVSSSPSLGRRLPDPTLVSETMQPPSPAPLKKDLTTLATFTILCKVSSPWLVKFVHPITLPHMEGL